MTASSPESNNLGSLTTGRRLAFLAKDSFLYGGAMAINKSFALITFPLLARSLSVTEYGVLDYFMVLGTLLSVAFVFGQDSAVARFFYEYEEREQRRQVISQSLFVQLTLLLAFIPLGIWGAEWLAARFIQIPAAEKYLRIVALQIPCLLLINFSQNLLKWTFNRTRFLIMSIGESLLNLIGVTLAVGVFQVDSLGVLTMMLLNQATFALLGIWFVRDWIDWPRGWRHVRELVAYAVPYGVICLIGAFLPAIERNRVLEGMTEDDLGLYAAGAKVAMLISMPIQAFQTAWQPFAMSIFRQPDAPHTYNAVLRIYSVGISIVALGLILVAAPVLRALASDRYVDGAVVVLPMALGLAIQSIGWITEIGISFSKRTYLKFFGYFAQLVSTIVAIDLLLPRLGLPGVALGSMIGYSMKAVIETIFAQWAFPMPWRFRGAVAILIGTGVLGTVTELLRMRYGIFASAAFCILGMAVQLGALWTIGLTLEERARLKNLLSRRKAGWET